jgi:hypothetical protein
MKYFPITAALVASLGACSIKEERTVQQPARRRRCHAGPQNRRLHRPGPRDGDHHRLHPLTMI